MHDTNECLLHYFPPVPISYVTVKRKEKCSFIVKVYIKNLTLVEKDTCMDIEVRQQEII